MIGWPAATLSGVFMTVITAQPPASRAAVGTSTNAIARIDRRSCDIRAFLTDDRSTIPATDIVVYPWSHRLNSCMTGEFPHISTDQVHAVHEGTRQRQSRAVAAVLAITEQGLRNRLLALEAQLGVELYRKVRGPRRLTVLTDAGHRFLPHALGLLERA